MGNWQAIEIQMTGMGTSAQVDKDGQVMGRAVTGVAVGEVGMAGN